MFACLWGGDSDKPTFGHQHWGGRGGELVWWLNAMRAEMVHKGTIHMHVK